MQTPRDYRHLTLWLCVSNVCVLVCVRVGGQWQADVIEGWRWIQTQGDEWDVMRCRAAELAYRPPSRAQA